MVLTAVPDRVEAAVQEAKRLLARLGYLDDRRTVIEIGFIDQIIERHDSMLLLLRNGKTGSEFALARSVVEGMHRGMR